MDRDLTGLPASPDPGPPDRPPPPPPGGTGGSGRTAGVLTAAVWSSTAGFLPGFLVGALAVVIRDDLALSAAQLGAAVGAFFAAGAVAAAPAGRYVQRAGAHRALRAGAIGSAACTAALALATTWWHLLGILVLAGASNAVAQIAPDLAIADAVPSRRQGLGWGVKTSCLPAATILAGLAVPLAAGDLGWRATCGTAALLGLGLVAILPRLGVTSVSRDASTQAAGRLPLRRLGLLGAAAGLVVGATNALGAFYVDAGVAAGLTPATAGAWLSGGSAVAVIARVGWGAAGDRMDRRHLHLVAALWLAGAAGIAALAGAGGTPGRAVATAVAFAAGSGWNALFMYRIVRSHPEAPAAASGVVMVGIFAGGVVGPALFGVLVDHGGYPVAWMVTGATLVVSAGLLLAGSRTDRPQIQHGI